MKKAFTLIELLTVMMIMGLMGTAAVGGYRAMQRGMEERGVMQNANSVIRAAYQRAQIDRTPTAIFFWNETLQGQTDDENEVVVGRAVAVRRHGRISQVIGSQLVDEFADLNLNYRTSDEEEDEGNNGSSANDTMYLYPMDNVNDLTSSATLKRSQVRSRVEKADMDALYFLSGTKEDNTIEAYAFRLENKGGVDWKAGMAYGLEFLSLQLPRGYIFGSEYSKSTENPVQPAGTLVFRPGINSGSGITTGGSVGRNKIAIYSLRPNGATLEAKSVGDTDSPEESL